MFNRLFLVTILFFFITITKTISQPVIKNGQLKVEGKYLINQNNNKVILRGVSFGWHNWWPRFYNGPTVKWLLDDWNCSVIRAAMSVEHDSGYIKKPEWSMEIITQVIDAAIKENIYVIADWHAHNIHLEAAKIFFTEIAGKYGNYPHIIYEIFNEPDKETWEEVKDYSIEIIKTIRTYDPDNIILVGSPHWDQDIDLVADDPISGFNNLMYTVHFYAATHQQWLRDKCEYALDKNIPLFISESASMKANGNGEPDIPEWEKWIDWMENNSISWITWSISDKKETCSLLLPSASSYGKWKEPDLNNSGKLIRSKLKLYPSVK